MSAGEYYNLFLKCQSTGRYQIITFDLVNSKGISSCERRVIQEKLIKLIQEMYLEINKLSEDNNKKILVFEEDFIHLWDNKKMQGFGMKSEPFILGDMVGFTVYRDSVTGEYIISLFNQLKEKYEINNNFHINTGYYETNDYCQGNELFFRGYCIEIISNLHKEEYKKRLKMIK